MTRSMMLWTRPQFWLAVITLVGGLMRFAYLLQIEHNTDRAYPLWQALMTLDHGIFPLIGQGTSVLFANPPLMGYALLPFVALTRIPLGAYVFVIALNTLGIWFTYKAARVAAGWRVGLIAAFLMAVNPWVIEYSRLTWVQGLLPFLVPALAWALWSAVEERVKNPARRMVVAFLLLTAAAQTYLLAFALVIPVGVILTLWLIGNPHRSTLWRGIVIGGVIFGAAAVVYGVGLLSERGTVEAQISQFGENPARLSDEALSHAIRLVTGQDYALARGVTAPAGDSAVRQAWSQAAHYLLVGALLIGTAAAVWRALKGERRGMLALIWWGVPVLLMSYVGQVVHPFYQLLGIPAGYVLAGMGIEFVISGQLSAVGEEKAPVRGNRVQRKGQKRRWGAAAVVAILFGVLMGINSIRYAQETAVNPGVHGLTALSLEYGIPLGQMIREYLPSGGRVFSDVEVWITSSLAGVTFDYLQDVRVPEVAIYAPTRSVYVSARSAEQVTYPMMASIRSSGSASLTLPDGWQLDVSGFEQTGIIPDSPLALSGDDGLYPVDYALTKEDDGGYSLMTSWRVDAISEGSLYAPFTHVFDASGNRILIVDGQAVPGYEWRPGDIHVHTMTFMLPEEGNPPYSAAIGQYDALRGENAIFITADGEYTPLITLPEEID